MRRNCARTKQPRLVHAEERAADAGLAGSFLAWLSTSTTTAFSRVQSGRGWMLVNGTPVATSPSELVNGAMLTPIAIDERGRGARGAIDEVWTGTNADGTTANNATCSAWTSDALSMNGLVGTTVTASAWFTELARDVPSVLLRE